MAGIRVTGRRSLGSDEELSPGDTLLLGDAPTQVSTVGSATLTAAQLVTGSIYRSGSSGAYTDTFDTATNVLAALAGNNPSAPVVAGHSFKLRIYNSVAFAETITLGAGMTAGVGTVSSVSASTWRDFLFQITSPQVPITNVANTVSGSAAVTWFLLPGQISELQGPSPLAININIGCSVTGSGIPANTTVIGITQGQGGTLGITLSANATATASNIALTFGPAITVHGLGSGTL